MTDPKSPIPAPQNAPNAAPEPPTDPTLYLPALSAAIITMLDEHERLTTTEIRQKTQANIHTIKKHVKELADWGLIQKHGSTKGAWYTKPLK